METLPFSRKKAKNRSKGIENEKKKIIHKLSYFYDKYKINL